MMPTQIIVSHTNSPQYLEPMPMLGTLTISQSETPKAQASLEPTHYPNIPPTKKEYLRVENLSVIQSIDDGSQNSDKSKSRVT